MTIPDEELLIEVVNPVKPGGQHVGIMPVTIRVTHLPTGLKAECGCARSQLKNKKVALSMIEWGLAEAFPQ